MATELEQAFIRYYNRINEIIKNVAILDKKNFIENKIETSSEFQVLVQATRDEFDDTKTAPDDDMTPTSMIRATHYESAWRHRVGNVLRRSCIYTKILEKKLGDPSDEFKNYVQEFKNSERKIAYLVALGYVSFEQNDIDCGYFQIKRFSRGELDAVLGNSINEIFYPWAAIELGEIKDYWFIYFEQIGPALEVDPPFLNFDLSDDIYRVKRRYSSLPEPIESAIKPLVLFDWQIGRGEPSDKKEEQTTGWMRFNIPFILKVTNSFYEFPFPAPALNKLDEDKIIESVTENGEEIWGRQVHISLGKQETESLRTFVKRTHENLQKLDFEKFEWRFFETALNFFVKAFFADGLEQLLWHITTIEALLGEDSAGLTEKLARRVAAICGKTKEKAILRKKFKKLYTFRSNLVHGNEFKKDVYWGHLREARDFARQTLVWFLEFLVMIQDGISQSRGNIKEPKRNLLLNLLDLVWFLEFLTIIYDGILQSKTNIKCQKHSFLLKLLDMDETELDIDKTGRSQLKALLQILPPEFPDLLEK
jgi:hypothetical protein